MSAFAQVPVRGASSAHHETLDGQNMVHLALSRHKDVRRALAARADAPLAIQAIRENPSTPPGALESLAGHPLPPVRTKAAGMLLRHSWPGSEPVNHPDAKIPELMERAPSLSALDQAEDVSSRNNGAGAGAGAGQGALFELDAAIAAAALFAELTCPVPRPDAFIRPPRDLTSASHGCDTPVITAT